MQINNGRVNVLAAMGMQVVVGIVIVLGLSLLIGCATFRTEARLPTGELIYSVEDSGAPLLSRKAGFKVKHEWLDAQTNTLHEISVERNTDEKADAQLAFMMAVVGALEKAYGVPAASEAVKAAE